MTSHDTGSTGTPPATAPPARTFGPQGPTLGELSDAYRRPACRPASSTIAAGAAARTLIRASVPERVAILLTGHKSRAIFDRDTIIHEQELLDAYLAQQTQAAPGPRGGGGRTPPGCAPQVGRTLPISQPIAEALARRRARRDPTSPLVFHRDGIPVRRWRTAWRTTCQGRCCTNRDWPARYPPTGSSPADAI